MTFIRVQLRGNVGETIFINPTHISFFGETYVVLDADRRLELTPESISKVRALLT